MIKKVFRMRKFIVILLFFLTVLPASSQELPEWFLDRSAIYGDYLVNHGDTLWTTFSRHEEDSLGIWLSPYDVVALRCDMFAVNDKVFSDVLVLMHLFRPSYGVEGVGLCRHPDAVFLLMVYSSDGHLLHHRSLGAGFLYGLSDGHGSLLFSDFSDKYRLAISRIDGAWYGITGDVKHKKSKILGIIPKKKKR